MADEIWVVRGSRPVLWTMPYRVRWHGRQAELLRVLPPLLAHQERALMDFFCEHHGNRFGVSELKAVAALLPSGMPPEESFSWERPRMAQLSAYKPETRKDRDDFLDSVYQRGLGQSRDEVEYWWNQFCNAMLDWLINRERPIDLYFMRVHATPFRRNWHFRSKVLSKFGVKLEEQVERGLMLAADREGVGRFIEAEMLPAWRKIVRGVENTRLKELGREGYAKAILDSARRWLPAAERIHREWLEDRKAPSIQFLAGVPASAMAVPQVKRGRRLGKRGLEIRRLARKLGFRPRIAGEPTLRIKEPRVRKVRVVQSPPEDLWHGRRYLPPPRFLKERFAGLLVLLADEKRHADELLALHAQPGDNGLAERVEQLAG